jgi:hypothetical protein
MSEKMSETSKMLFGVVAVFVIGFVVVGLSKMDTATNEQKQGAAQVTGYAALHTLASQKCPAAIMAATKEQVYFTSETESDKETYLTLKWMGEKADKGGFKKASCTVRTIVGGITELIIDDKVLISKKPMPLP